MGNLKRILKSTVAVILASLMLLTVVACGKDSDKSEIRCDKTELGSYDSVKLTAVIDGKEVEFEDSDCIITPANLARVEDGVLKIITAVTEDTKLTVKIVIGDTVLSKEFTVKKPADISEINGPKITLTASSDKLSKDDDIVLTVKIENTADLGYTFSVSDPDLIEVDSATGVLKAKDLTNLQFNKYVTVTATLTSDPTKSASKQILLQAPARDGESGYLTSAAIRKLSNASITVNSVMQDHYKDLISNQEDASTYYGKVMMEENKWYGAWKNDAANAEMLEESYVRSEADNYYNNTTYTDYSGNVVKVTGHALMQQFVNKNNEVETSVVKNYVSQAAIWERQHLWNHLGDFANIADFSRYTYSPDDMYRYHLTLNDKDMDELYLFTYLSYSFTPLLEDTINDVVFVLNDDGDIVKMVLSTEVIYDNGTTTDPKEAESMQWTTAELTFSDIGSTTIPSVTPYEAPENVDKLDAALAEIKAAKSYQYQLTDTSLRAPTYDDSEYELQSVSTSAATTKSAKASARVATLADESDKPALYDRTRPSGTVGQRAWITEQGILFEETTKYQYTMDGDNAYKLEYTGYKPFDGYYERFLWDATERAYKGVEHIKGSMYDALPQFDFSTALFEYVESQSTNSKYVFKLQASAVTRAIAKEICSHTTAKSGEALSQQALTITVDGNGKLLEIKYPYSMVSGTYMGYCTMTFSNIGSATLPDSKLFNGYIEREVKTNWSQFTTDYRPNHSTQGVAQFTDTATVMKTIFGDEAYGIMPPPTLFTEIIGDHLGGGTGSESGTKIWFNWKDGAAEGQYIDYLSVTIPYPKYDENAQIDNDLFEEVRAKFRVAFEGAGFTYDAANSTAPNANGNRYLCFARETSEGSGEGIEIVIQNIGSKWLYVDIYSFGAWTLKK